MGSLGADTTKSQLFHLGVTNWRNDCHAAPIRYGLPGGRLPDVIAAAMNPITTTPAAAMTRNSPTRERRVMASQLPPMS
jgi:hypothetical protein